MMAKIKFEDDLVVGNIEDKANLKNPISRALVEGFDNDLMDLISKTNPASLHEVGCGEGRLLQTVRNQFSKIELIGSELSEAVLEEAQALNIDEPIHLKSKNIYDIDKDSDYADVIVCCEVLEHLDDPQKAAETLRKMGARQYVMSVPNEPIWRILNFVRGKYWRDLGNTPGHLNHWSKKGFIKFLESVGFLILDVKSPLPWTIVRAQVK